MKRGETWTVAGGSGYAGKPRPAVIIQDERMASTASVTICGFTTMDEGQPFFRLPIIPDEENGLRLPSAIMVDKIVTVPRSRLGARLGQLAAGDLRLLDRALLVFLGLAE